MKTLITLITLIVIFTSISICQDTTLNAGDKLSIFGLYNYQHDYQPWESEWILQEIVFVGDTTCEHSFATKKESKNGRIGCCVLHDSRGCPDNWDKLTKICRKCYREEVWYENRILVKPIPTEFEILEQKVQDKLKK
jgi:hypothetical protein